MMHKWNIGIFLIVSILSGCEKEPALFESAGPEITVEFDKGNFTQIELYDVFDVVLIQDTLCKISVTAGENILPAIQFVNDSGVLKIDNAATFRWSRAYTRPKLHIRVNKLEKIVFESPSKITSANTIMADHLTIYAISNLNEGELDIDANLLVLHSSYTSTGKFILKGKANRARFKVYAAYHLDASAFNVSHALVRNASIQDLEVNVSEYMEMEILNSGNIILTGKPAINITDNSGSGKLVRK